MTDTVWFNALDVVDTLDRLDVVFVAGAYVTGLKVLISITDTVWLDVVDVMSTVGVLDVVFIIGA